MPFKEGGLVPQGNNQLTTPKSLETGEIFLVEGGESLSLETNPEKILAVDWKLINKMVDSSLAILENEGINEQSSKNLEHVMTVIYIAATKLKHEQAEVAEQLAPFEDQTWMEKARDLLVAVLADTFGTKSGQGAVELQKGKLKAQREGAKLRQLESELSEKSAALTAQVDVQLDNRLRQTDPEYARLHEKFMIRLAQLRQCHGILSELRVWKQAQVPQRAPRSDLGERIQAEQKQAAKQTEAKLPQFRMLYDVFKKEFPDLPALQPDLVFLFESAEIKINNAQNAQYAELKQKRDEEFNRLLNLE